MRKKFLLAFLAVVGLGSLVVLGSSPELVGKIISSAQNNLITRAFSTEAKHDSEGKVPESADSIGQISLKTNETLPPEVPEAVLWPVIFSLPERLDTEAEKARSVGEDDSLWRDYFVRQAKISRVSGQILRETSVRFFAEVAPIVQQAALVIRQVRERNPQPSLNPDGSISEESAIPDELKTLQNQKDEVALRLRDGFREAIGEKEFAKFSEFLANEFAKGFVRHELKPNERTPQSVPANNGFESFGGTNKGGDRQ